MIRNHMVTNMGAGVFHAVADPIRRKILDRLRRGPAGTGRIARDFPVSRPAVSKHLRVLLEAGLVRSKRAGRSRVYTLAAGSLRRIDDWLGPFRELWEKNPDSGAPADGEEGRAPRTRSRRGAKRPSARPGPPPRR